MTSIPGSRIKWLLRSLGLGTRLKCAESSASQVIRIKWLCLTISKSYHSTQRPTKSWDSDDSSHQNLVTLWVLGTFQECAEKCAESWDFWLWKSREILDSRPHTRESDLGGGVLIFGFRKILQPKPYVWASRDPLVELRHTYPFCLNPKPH